MNRFAAVIARELKIALRQGGDASLTVVFFVLAAALFPLGLGPEPALLLRISGGIIWVVALLASMLALERLFQPDHDDGSLDLLALSPLPLEAVVLAKSAANWLLSGLPIVAAAPVLALVLHMEAAGFGALIGALLLGTPTLSLIGAVGAALTLGARRGGVLMPLLILPLYVPILVFGVGAVDAAAGGLTPRPHLLILGGLLLGALPLGAWASAAALRQALD